MDAQIVSLLCSNTAADLKKLYLASISECKLHMLAHKTCLHKSRVNRISDSGKLIINADMDLSCKRRNLIMLLQKKFKKMAWKK